MANTCKINLLSNGYLKSSSRLRWWW